MRAIIILLLTIIVLSGCGKKKDTCPTKGEGVNLYFSFDQDSYEDLDSVIMRTYKDDGFSSAPEEEVLISIHDSVSLATTNSPYGGKRYNCTKQVSPEYAYEFHLKSTGKTYRISDVTWWQIDVVNPWDCSDRHQGLVGHSYNTIHSYRLNDILHEFDKPERPQYAYYYAIILIH